MLCLLSILFKTFAFEAIAIRHVILHLKLLILLCMIIYAQHIAFIFANGDDIEKLSLKIFLAKLSL